MKRRLAELNVTLNPMLTIFRCLRLEKHLLQKPSKFVKRRVTTVNQPTKMVERRVTTVSQPAKVVERRHNHQTAAQLLTLNPTKIPFGVRGRKRQTLLFVGLQPNLDGIMPRKAATAEPSQQSTTPLRNVATAGPSQRATSAPRAEATAGPLTPLLSPIEELH